MSKIALVQFKASIEKEKNLPKILGYIKQAAKNNADMVTFPEYMMFYTPPTRERKDTSNIPCTTLFSKLVVFAYLSFI